MSFPKSASEFASSIKNLAFPEKYCEWIKQISSMEELKENGLEYFYKDFLEVCPFNHSYWNKYAQLINSINGREEALKIYQKAVEMNPRSLDLWNCYCSWVNYTFNTQLDLIGGIYEKAVEQIGYDFNSYIIWDSYLNFEIQRNVEKAHGIFFNLIKYPINKLENYSLRFKDFLNSLSELDIMNIYHKYYPKLDNEAQDLKGIMIKIFDNDLKKTLSEIKDRKNFENQIKKAEYDENSEKELNIWLDYIEHEKMFGKKERTAFVYEKALITQSGNVQLWLEYLESLEESYENITLLSLLQKYKTFYKSLDINILYYWTDFLENFDIEKARVLYIELQKENSSLKSYIRQVQLEIRGKNYSGARSIYDNIINIFSEQPKILSFILVEYWRFLSSYFNDISSIYNHFQSYFEKNIYSRNFLSIFLNYLKELFAENESELQTYISSIGIKALKKANEISKQELDDSFKIIINFVRNNFSVIQEIKIFEKKIKNLYKNLTKTKEEKELNETEMVLKKRVHSELDGKEVSSHSNPSKHLKIESI